MAVKSIRTDAGLTPDDRLANALAEANVKSGVGNLPVASNVPLAFATGEVQKTDVPEVPFTAPGVDIARQQATLAQIEKTPGAEAIVGLENVAYLKADAAKLEDAARKTAPPPPPIQMGMGNSTHTFAATMRTNPFNLHAANPFGAKDYWQYFFPNTEIDESNGEKFSPERRRLAMLAKQGGLGPTPIAWFSQQIAPLLQVTRYEIPADKEDAPFAKEDSDRTAQTYKTLVECFGDSTADEIYRQCERKNISLRTGVYKLGLRVIAIADERLHGTQRTQNLDDWS